MRPVERVLERLEGVRESNGSWKALCPAHDDREPSLSVLEGDDGRALIKCFAGCQNSEIVGNLGLEMRDLFEPNGHHSGRKKSLREPTAVWHIKDSNEETRAVHVRFDYGPGDKSCLWRLPGAGLRDWGLKGLKLTELPLYRSEHVAEWPKDLPVVVTEGEKAADALAAVYEPTLATVTGASNTPGLEALEVLRGLPVVLWADNDEEGRRHMERIAVKLQGIAADVRVFECADAPPKSDAADHPAVLSRSREDVRELLGAMAATPIYSSATSTQGADERKPVFKTAKEVAGETPAEIP